MIQIPTDILAACVRKDSHHTRDGCANAMKRILNMMNLNLRKESNGDWDKQFELTCDMQNQVCRYAEKM